MNPGLSAGAPPATQKNETNPIHRPNNQKMRNEPNFSPANRQSPTAKSQKLLFTKRTQLSTWPTPKYAKRTQFTARPYPKCAKRTQFPYTKCPPAPQKCETNPICPPHVFSQPAHTHTNYAKQTQFPPRPTTQMRKTNPIYTPANSQPPKANSCFLRNEPNSRMPKQSLTAYIHSTYSNLSPRRPRKTNPITEVRYPASSCPCPSTSVPSPHRASR